MNAVEEAGPADATHARRRERPREGTDIGPGLERHRHDLVGYCYRMLGSAFEAEDAVQEALVRAWRNLDRYDESRASLRTWLFTIATNVCLDMLRSAQRRARAMDLGPASYAGAALGVPLPENAWIQPVPDTRVLPEGGDPADLAAQRETVRLAFVAALQHLPPRQRAVLILRDVLCWSAAEVAHLLDTTVAAANSALQRARATLDALDIASADPYLPMDDAQRSLLARYCDAVERYDVEALVSLLHEDATMSMPPFAWWLRSQYRPTGPDGGYEPFALVILDLSDGSIAGMTTYLDAARLFPLFGLPTGADADASLL